MELYQSAREKYAFLILFFLFTLIAHCSSLAPFVYSNGEFHQKAVEEAGGNEDAAVKLPPGISQSGQKLPEEAASAETPHPSAEVSGQNPASSSGSASSQQNTGAAPSSLGAGLTIFLALIALCVVILGVQYISVKGTIQKK